MHPLALATPLDAHRPLVAALLVGTYARLEIGSTATEWAFDSVPVDTPCAANVSASKMKSFSPPGACRAAKKYLLLPGLYQISSPPPLPANAAITAPVFSLMMAVLAAGAPPMVPTLQPRPICGAGPIARPGGPVQALKGTMKVPTIVLVTGSMTTTPPGTELL